MCWETLLALFHIRRPVPMDIDGEKQRHKYYAHVNRQGNHRHEFPCIEATRTPSGVEAYYDLDRLRNLDLKGLLRIHKNEAMPKTTRRRAGQVVRERKALPVLTPFTPVHFDQGRLGVFTPALSPGTIPLVAPGTVSSPQTIPMRGHQVQRHARPMQRTQHARFHTR